MRRFVCRRGQVKHLRSDNGTNLVGAQTELKKALMSLNHRRIQDALLTEQIQWSLSGLAGYEDTGAGSVQSKICLFRYKHAEPHSRAEQTEDLHQGNTK